MASYRPLLCILLTTVWLCTLINAAAINNLIYANELTDYADDLGGRSEGLITLRNGIRTRRAIESEGQSSSVKPCHDTTPCGWAVYIPFSRRVDFFMKNTCQCPTPRRCIRTDDDLSVSAYVYRCRENATDLDIGSPDESSTNN